MGRFASWRGFPLAFFGYGFLYAWGYVSWSTDSLATRSVAGGEFDLSWLVSAAVVPAALVVLALIGRRRDLERVGWLYAAAPVLALAGTVLSVVYQYVAPEWLARALAVASGLGTGCASALFGLLWSLALARLCMEVLEAVVPLSFAVSVLCALVVPSLPQVPALVVALLLVVLCAGSLVRCRVWIAGQQGAEAGPASPWFESGQDEAPGVCEGVPGVARMLVFGVVAWTVMGLTPPSDGPDTGLAGVWADAASQLVGGVDLVGALGYALAIVLALLIIRYAVRVDFQALALMTLPVLVLSMTLYAGESHGAVFCANVLNVALNSCCEVVLLLYFIRLAKARDAQRPFWLAVGSAASYLGVLLGQLLCGLFDRAGLAAGDPALFCLVVVCMYVFAMLLIPQRTYAQAGMGLPVDLQVPGTAAQPASPVPSPRPVTPAASAIRSPAGRPAVSAASPAATLPVSLSGRLGETCPSCSVVSDARASTFPASPAGPSAIPGEGVSPRPDAISQACACLAQRYRLSAREEQVCELLARGRSQTYIRDELFLSKNTVATHVRRLYAKLGVHSKQELIDLVEGR